MEPSPAQPTSTARYGRPQISIASNEPAGIDRLPPHSYEAECGAIGCVLLTGSGSEGDGILRRLKPAHFYDLRNRRLHAELTTMRMEGHEFDTIVIADWLRGRKAVEAVGGLEHVSYCLDSVPSIVHLSEYLRILEEKRIRRLAIQKGYEIANLASAEEVTPTELKAAVAEILDQTDVMTQNRPLIELWTIADAKAYKPDPRTFMVGAGIISHGEIIAIAGPPSVGKSLLANTLVFAGARGEGEWMGYHVHRRWRSLIIQSEGSPTRLKRDLSSAPDELQDWVKISLPCSMQFSNPAFRQEVRRIFDSWPFDLLVVDNWTNVCKSDQRDDSTEALANVIASLPGYPDRPAVCMLAHPRKGRPGENWAPRTGRALRDELAGSYTLGAACRTVLFLQPGSNEPDDPTVIFDCAKSNNTEHPLPMSAWLRDLYQFRPLPGFDFESWLKPPDRGGKEVDEATLAKIFAVHGPTLTRTEVVALLKETGVSSATAYRVFHAERFKDRLWTTDNGRFGWRGDS